MKNLKLNLALFSTTLRPSIGRWSILERGQTWKDFARGEAQVFRAIRVQGMTYWISAQRVNNCSPHISNNVARALRLPAKPRRVFTYFTLHLNDPRQDRSSGTGFGTGVINPLPDVIRSEKDFQAECARQIL